MTVWRRGGECGGCWGVCVVGVSVICRSLRAPHAIPGNSVPPAGGCVCCVCVWCGAPWRRVESGRYTRRASGANSSNTANRALSTVSASTTRGKITVCNNKATTSRVGIGRLQFVAAQRSSHTEKTQQPGNSLLHAVLQRISLCEVVAWGQIAESSTRWCAPTAYWEECSSVTADVGQASRRCDVLIHLQKESLVIDITRACRLMHTPAERRRLFDVKEREKFNAYPPLAPGKRLVPLVLNDLGGVNEMGMAALRAIAKEGARSKGSRVADAVDIVLGGGATRAPTGMRLLVGRGLTGPVVADPAATGDDDEDAGRRRGWVRKRGCALRCHRRQRKAVQCNTGSLPSTLYYGTPPHTHTQHSQQGGWGNESHGVARGARHATRRNGSTGGGVDVVGVRWDRGGWQVSGPRQLAQTPPWPAACTPTLHSPHPPLSTRRTPPSSRPPASATIGSGGGAGRGGGTTRMSPRLHTSPSYPSCVGVIAATRPVAGGCAIPRGCGGARRPRGGRARRGRSAASRRLATPPHRRQPEGVGPAWGWGRRHGDGDGGGERGGREGGGGRVRKQQG